MEFWLAITIGLVILFSFLLGGLWIGVALTATGVIGLYLFTSISVENVIGNTIWNVNNKFELVALPLFILMGELLSKGGAIEDLFAGLSSWTTRLPGKLIHANILSCSFFAAVSGSSAATTATVGRITLPEFKKRGYDFGLSIGSLAGAGTLGFLIPPSVIMIVYGALAGQSIGQLFIAGVLPGIMLSFMFMAYIAARGIINPAITPTIDVFSWRDRAKSLLLIAPTVALIVAVLGSIYLGWATATESAAIGVFGAVVIGLTRRSLNWANFKTCMYSAIYTTCMCMLIVTGASLFALFLTFMEIPNKVAQVVVASGIPTYAILALLAVFYVILGCLLDGFSMLVTTLPVTYPLVINVMGYDPIWFGIVLVVLIEIAQITPPVGFNLFIIQDLAKIEITEVAKHALPFFFLMLVALVILTAWPNIPLWLPQQMIR